MACLGSVTYDPAASVSKATTALLAMTAIDATNCRITFTAPANGAVLVRLRGVIHGATTAPQILLGVLDGATVQSRMAPLGGKMPGAATAQMPVEICCVVDGLTPGNSYTWDAAYAVEFVVAATGLKYGGPNDTTTNNAFGALVFEIWETWNLLGSKLYDPAAAVSKATSSLLAMTALDTTNLRITFTCPPSGRVLHKQRFMVGGGVSIPSLAIGVLDGATVRGRVCPLGGQTDFGGVAATTQCPFEASAIISGLTPGNSYTFDAAYGVENVVASSAIKYGGPNTNATQADAFGAYSYEIWAA